MVCGRCGHHNEALANYCSSCGAPLAAAADEETTLTLAAVEAAEEHDDLARYLQGLAPGSALLVVRQGPAAGSSYRLDRDVTMIGRHPDSEIFLDDITVSRRHVRVRRYEGREFFVDDQGSLNGTYVNRERVDSRVLKHGDEVQVGRYRFTFVQGEG
jgi:FHA domain